jgi:hypothetical protein
MSNRQTMDIKEKKESYKPENKELYEKAKENVSKRLQKTKIRINLGSTQECQTKDKMQIYDDALTYFEDKSFITEVRSDISHRFSYLEYYISKDGLVHDKSKKNEKSENKKEEKQLFDDHCCQPMLHSKKHNDNLTVIIYETSKKRNKYASEWKCNKTVSLSDFKSSDQVLEWLISGRCIQCQNYAFSKDSQLKGQILFDTFICHNLHDKKPKNSYDLFYTYITRVFNDAQLLMCQDTICCYPKDKSKVFVIEIDN